MPYQCYGGIGQDPHQSFLGWVLKGLAPPTR